MRYIFTGFFGILVITGLLFFSCKLSDEEETPGSSCSTAIEIPAGPDGIEGILNEEHDEMWYTFSRDGIGTLFAYGKMHNETPYTANIMVDLMDSDQTILKSDFQMGNGILQRITNAEINWAGKYYVKVKPLDNDISNNGTYVLIFGYF